MTDKKQDTTFKQTLNLPMTDFPIRAQPAVDDARILERWQKENLFRTSYDCNSGSEKFILHDGPPYANGHLHLGHAYNKILKDIVTKAHRMIGYHTPVKPGWDCHGLPIELRVTQEKPWLERNELIKACREYATQWIDIQRKEFKSLGVLMDWDRPFTTMSKSYEASTVKAFGLFVRDGFIERKNKTVPWCAHCHTVLAAAEYEHKERKDPSIYVTFDLKQEDTKRLFPTLAANTISVVVWTTTPWTLPLNQAILAKPGASYVVVDLKGRQCLVGADVADFLCDNLGAAKLILEKLPAEKLKGIKLLHPFVNKEVPLILDDSVGVSEGTAFVHCAPGCGPSDYEIGVKNNLDIYSPISANGLYTDLIIPKELAGMPVTDGQGWVIKKLEEVGSLLYKGSIRHSYPHCWRCRNGLIFRATRQWFINLEHNNIRQRVLDVIDNINFIPAPSKSFLKATVESRWEWCLSRQRTWGCPIPALLCTNCDYAYLDMPLIDAVTEAISREGIEYWSTVQVEDLPRPVACPQCGEKEFKKEMDILDVWFESGISHYAVLHNNPELAYPADMYLEGVDQHRAWFQSSLITSMILEGSPCTRAFMTHGYTVDEKGQKMSKSLGNVVAPEDIIKKLGTDGLRLWVSSIGNEKDPVVSDVLLKNVAEVQRKIRNTCRFLLSNLYDFDREKDALQPEKMLPLDVYAIAYLSEVSEGIIRAYLAGDFTSVFHDLADYCSGELSSFYLDIVKDRLYCEEATGYKRRSAQTALWYILDTITRITAPILSFTAEQVSDYYQKDKKESIHLQPFVDPALLRAFALGYTTQGPRRGAIPIPLRSKVGAEEKELAYFTQWQTLKDIRSVLLKAIEEEREKGLIKHSLEVDVTVWFDPDKFPGLASFVEQLGQREQSEEFFKAFLIVSKFSFASSQEGLQPSIDKGIAVLVRHAEGVKCPRCWHWSLTKNPDNLDPRCESVLARE